MVSATRVPNNHTVCLMPMDPTEYLAPRIDRSYHLVSSQLRLGRCRRTHRAADLLIGGRRYARHPRAIVTFARRHQPPGDAGVLVGKCHGREFRRLALEQVKQPARRTPRALRACWITAVAPATSRLRNISSPARVIL